MIKNIRTLISGTVAAQLFTLLISPLLSRLYTPEDFGKLGIILAASSILATSVHGRLTLAISRSSSQAEARAIFSTATVISITFSIISALVVMLVAKFFDSKVYSPTIIISIILMTALTAQIDIFNYWQSYQKNYSLTAKNTIYRSIATGLTQVISSSLTSAGLVIGVIVGSTLSVALSTQKGRLEKAKVDMLSVLIKYKEYPFYSMPQGLLASASLNSAPLLLSSFFGSGIAGQYWLAYRVLLAPIALFGGSYRQVFYAELAAASISVQQKILTARKHTLIALAVTFPACLIFTLFGKAIFSIVFGESWATAGNYSGWLVLCFSMDIIKIPSNIIIQTTGQHKKLLTYEALLTLGRVAVLLFFCAFYTPLLAVQAFSILSAVAAMYLVLSVIKLRERKE